MTLPTAAPPADVRLAHCLLDAQGTVLSAHAPDLPFYAASTIKLHVLLAALRAADEGRLDVMAEVPAARTFTGIDGAPFTLGGDHLEASHPAECTAVPVRELLVRMIDRSSNEATNQIAELIGLPAIAALIDSLGLRATRMERLIGDGAALAQGLTNETSAADLATTMLHAIRPGPGAALAREALGAQRIPVIATALRSDVPWGSKSGWVDGYRHDVAHLGEPADPDLRVLAVMTGGLAQDEADQRIRDLVRELCGDLTA